MLICIFLKWNFVIWRYRRYNMCTWGDTDCWMFIEDGGKVESVQEVVYSRRLLVVKVELV